MPDTPIKELSRRGFLGKMSRGLVVASATGAFLKSAAGQQPVVVPDPPGKKMGYAIVGLGMLSINEILPAFAKCEKSKPVAFVSGHPDKANKLALRYGINPKNIYNYENYGTIKDNPEVDIIYIVLPNFMHAEYTIRGFQAGKHVLTEKPMAATPADCQQMIDAGRKAGKKLMVAYRCRYEPYNQEAIRIAHSGDLGPILVIEADAGWNATNPDQWRLKKDLAGGGSLMDIGIYALNGSRYLSGEEPTEVNAMIYNVPGDPRFKEVEETVNFQLRFPSGTIANCTSSYGYYPTSHFRVIGTKGWLEMDPATWYRDQRLKVGGTNGIVEQELPSRDHFALEMDHMSQCVMENKEPLTPGEEGLRDIKLMMAIYESAQTGKTVKV
ncbi:MAG: Gfo/Idh/MocA family oxidoreductase [Candidatus Acidiferrum sp.]|jgi:predicted dehydrogenase